MFLEIWYTLVCLFLGHKWLPGSQGSYWFCDRCAALKAKHGSD